MTTVKVEDYELFREKLLQWAATFEYCAFLEDALSKKIRVGVGAEAFFSQAEALPANNWLFGYLTYDYKNKLEDLVSENPETISFDECFFFQPQIVIVLTDSGLCFEKSNVDTVLLREQIENTKVASHSFVQCSIKNTLTRAEYISRVQGLQEHIQRGNIYEVNFCQEFVAKQVKLQPHIVYDDLVTASPMPFAAFLRQGEKYAFCSSPERYVRKSGSKIISQPIKGTGKRGATTEEDEKIINALQNNPKERAENVMAVDVVRNDLARIAVPGSVEVDELCEVYTFQQLHQMISTVSATLPENVSLSEILQASFPMASMTGAPKIRAMQLIEEYEKSKRGLYSGTIGYVAPNGDFDFNVVIRTILYDAEAAKLSFTVGSAITAEADAEKEYEECLLKAAAIRKILSA